MINTPYIGLAMLKIYPRTARLLVIVKTAFLELTLILIDLRIMILFIER